MTISILGTRGFPYVYSGYETFVAELAPRLAQRGHRVTIYCHSNLFNDRPEEYQGVRLVYFPSIETKTLSQFTHSFLSTLHVVLTKVDAVLFVNSANGPFGLLTWLFGKKSVINVDGLEWMRPKWRGLGSRYFYFASWLATRLFDIVVTDSKRMAEVYEREFQVASVTIAYGANIGKSEQPDLIVQLGLSCRNFYLVVGRMVPDNNVDLLVKAFERTGSKKKLVVLGDVPYADKYAQRVRGTRDPRIVFPGYVKDPLLLKELYCNCYAYLHGHEFGGTNPTLLKAMAYRTFILALDTPFNREVLGDGECGLFFDKSVRSLSRLLEGIESQEDMAEHYRGRGPERIRQHYTWDRITDQYEMLFQSLATR